MKKLMTYYLRPYYGRMSIGFIIKFVGSIMDLCLPWILAYMIDEVIPLKDTRQIYQWGAIMILCSLSAVALNIVANRMASKVARDTTYHLRNDLFKKIMYLSEAQLDTYTKPSLITRLTTDTYHVHQMIGRVQRLGVRAPILLIGGIVITLTLDPVLTGLLVVTLPFLAWIMIGVSKKGIPMYGQLQKKMDYLIQIIREDISGIRVIKALSKADYESGRFAHWNQEVVSKEQHVGVIMATIDPCVTIIMNMALVGVIVIGAYRVQSGASEIGKILAFISYFTIILNAMIAISKMFMIFSKAVASATRIEVILESEEDLQVMTVFPEELGSSEEVEESYDIVFEQVSFHYYQEGSIEALHNVDLKIRKGETLGILGGTGAGKTTLIALLLRLYDVTSGQILIKGQDIKAIPPHELRQLFGVVFQNDSIFEGTILENVDLGRSLEEEDIEKAIQYAQAAAFIAEKEEGIHTVLNVKGTNLSGGQKQRLLIARALANKPEILILDDASSALDYGTDARLRQVLHQQFGQMTKVIVSQRISAVKQANHILVLDKGKVVGYGDHRMLMEQCSLYRQMNASQMGGRLDEVF